MIDAMLDTSMSQIMHALPLSSTVKQALISSSGEPADNLALVIAYERGDWTAVERLSGQLGINSQKVPGFYADAVQWSSACSSP